MKVQIDTVIRTVILCLAIINHILTATGHSIIPIENQEITEMITLGFTIGAALISWWKNNSFTCHAIAADKHLKTLKEQHK